MLSSEEAEKSTAIESVEQPRNVLIQNPGEGIVSLASSLEDLKKRMQLLSQLKKEILTEDDFAEFNIKQKNGTTRTVKAIKKSGCLKYAVAFNLTTIVTQMEKVWINENSNQFAWHVTVQCIAPNGRITEELGVCDNVTDRPNQSEHVIKTMAKTRGTSRAIIGMVGTADTTAEDMSSVKDSTSESDIPKLDKKYCQCGKDAEFGTNSRVCLKCGGVEFTQ